MALKNTLILGSLVAALAVSSTASGQIHTPSATFEHRAIEMPDNTGPMVTPGVFNYDAQMFAPFELTNDKQMEPSCGFFFTIDKTLTSVSRSDRNGSGRNDVPIGNDWNWGERYQFGWMTEQDSGWHGAYQSSQGTYYAQGDMDDAFRFIGFNTDGSSTAGEQLIGFGPRVLQLGDGSVTGNAFDYSVPFGSADSFSNQFHIGELNRVFRQALKNGDYFEPYLGARYTNVNDRSLQDAVYYYLPNDTFDPDSHDLVAHRFRQHVTNSAIGFQLGGRHNRRRGRWLYSTDGAIAASYNHQRYASTDIFFVDRERGTIEESYSEENSFVPTLDLEVGISFNVTRDITLRGGAQLMYLWGGIARVNTLPAQRNPNSASTTSPFIAERFPNIPQNSVSGTDTVADLGAAGLFNDSYTAAGFTFGAEWKR